MPPRRADMKRGVAPDTRMRRSATAMRPPVGAARPRGTGAAHVTRPEALMIEAKLRRIDALERQAETLSQELNAVRRTLDGSRRAHGAEQGCLREARNALVAVDA